MVKIANSLEDLLGLTKKDDASAKGASVSEQDGINNINDKKSCPPAPNTFKIKSDVVEKLKAIQQNASELYSARDTFFFFMFGEEETISKIIIPNQKLNDNIRFISEKDIDNMLKSINDSENMKFYGLGFCIEKSSYIYETQFDNLYFSLMEHSTWNITQNELALKLMCVLHLKFTTNEQPYYVSSKSQNDPTHNINEDTERPTEIEFNLTPFLLSQYPCQSIHIQPSRMIQVPGKSDIDDLYTATRNEMIQNIRKTIKPVKVTVEKYVMDNDINRKLDKFISTYGSHIEKRLGLSSIAMEEIIQKFISYTKKQHNADDNTGDDPNYII